MIQESNQIGVLQLWPNLQLPGHELLLVVLGCLEPVYDLYGSHCHGVFVAVKNFFDLNL